MNQNTLRALFFYALSGDSTLQPAETLADHFDLIRIAGADSKEAFSGSLHNGTTLQLSQFETHDTLILAVEFTNQDNTGWSKLHAACDSVCDWLHAPEQTRFPWAISRLFYNVISSSTGAKQPSEVASALADCLNLQHDAGNPETTPFGWFWVLSESAKNFSEKTRTWQRDLLLVIPEDRAQKVQSAFIDNFHQGFTRIELYLQKCKYLAHQHERIRGDLAVAIAVLQDEMLEHLVSADFSQIQAEPVLMEEMSRQLMRFLTQKAAVEILLNSMRTNLTLFQEHLERMKLNTASYQQEAHRMTRQIEQLETDLQNAAVVQDSATAIQDIQRGAEGSRFERASYMLGYTAALLAGISLFNSFLDIWSLVVENSAFILPPAGLRIALSLVASVAIPLAATWIITRRKLHALIASLISLGTIIAMVLVTLFNRF